jgi:MYXO-CTERM domain-containing protein
VEDDAGFWGEDDAGELTVDEPPPEGAVEVPSCSVGAVGSGGGTGMGSLAGLIALGAVALRRSRRRRG